MNSFRLHARMLSSLILSWQPKPRKFMSVTTLAYPEDCFVFVLHSLWPLQSFCLLFCSVSRALWRRWNMDVPLWLVLHSTPWNKTTKPTWLMVLTAASVERLFYSLGLQQWQRCQEMWKSPMPAGLTQSPLSSLKASLNMSWNIVLTELSYVWY